MLTLVAAYTVSMVLLVAVAERLLAPRALPAALRAHRVLPAGAVRPVAVAVTAAEAVLAVAVVTRAHPLAPVGAALLFAGYGGYASHVAGTGRGGPCGCGGVAVPMDGWVAGRAFALAGLAALAAVPAGSVPAGPPLLVVLLAAATLATLLWHLPGAMRDPARAHGGPTRRRASERRVAAP